MHTNGAFVTMAHHILQDTEYQRFIRSIAVKSANHHLSSATLHGRLGAVGASFWAHVHLASHKECRTMTNPLSKSTLFSSFAFAALCIAGSAAGMPSYGEWSDPVRVQSPAGPVGPLATPAVDGCVSLSRDGREMYFTSNRTGNFDIYVARRTSMTAQFGAPERLSSNVNTATDEACPSIIGRNTLYFIRTSATDRGDFYVSRRSSGDWGPATSVPSLNSPQLDETVSMYEDDDGREVLIWSKRNADGSNGEILQSVDGAPPELVLGSPNGPGSNNRPSITHDGKIIFFDSTRSGGLGGPDIWYATRESTSEDFGPALHLAELSSPGFDARPTISWDGTQIFFSSNRQGSASPFPDIWMASRDKAGGPKVVEFPGGD
jgi:Tol biopolymer transport system component